MTHWKKVGLILAASLAIAAAIATPGAAAKDCSTEGKGASCGTAHGNEWTGQFQFESTSVEFEVGMMKVTCSGSTGTGEITKSETGTGKLTSLTFSGCKDQTGSSCTATTNLAEPAAFTIEHTTNTDGWMSVGPMTTTWSCFFFTCKYVSNPAKLLILGGETADLVANKVLESLESGSGLCSNTAVLSGAFKITKPDSFFIT